MSWLQRSSRLIRLLTVLLTVVVVASCTTPDSGHPPPEKTNIKLGVLNVLGAAPVFLASESGFFAEEGLQVEFVTIQGAGTAVPSMVSGELDLVFGNYVSFFSALGKGTATVKFVADGYYAKPRTWMVLVAKNSALRRPSDLGGKRVAVTTVNSLAELTIKSVLSTSATPVASPVFVEMAYTGMETALKNGAVDAALLSEPYVTDLSRKIGALPLFDAAAGATADMPVSGYATTDKFAAANPNTVAAFQRALSRGAEIAETDRTRVELAIQKYAGVDAQTAALVTLVGFPTRMDPTRLQRVPDLMTAFGALPGHLDARNLILPSAMAGTT